MKNKIFEIIMVTMGGLILYKLHDVKEEIKYFETQKGIYFDRKRYYEILKKESEK